MALGSGRGLASKPKIDVCPEASAGSTRRELGRPPFLDTESSRERAANGTSRKGDANERRNPTVEPQKPEGSYLTGGGSLSKTGKNPQDGIRLFNPGS
jgi:hypothetical protein